MTVVVPAVPPATAARARRLPAAAGVAGSLALATLAGMLAAAGAEESPAAVGLARGVIVGAPLLIGLHAWRSDRTARFGALLMGLGGAWFLATFAESDAPGWYVAGRTAGWGIEVLLVYIALAFPTGRLRDRADRMLVGAMALVALTLYVPQLVLAESLPLPSPYTSCTDGCPSSPLFALATEPSSLVDVMRSVGALLIFTIDVAVVARLARRMRRPRSITRSMLAPVTVVVAGRAALMGVAIVARQVAPGAPALEQVAWALALATPALALAFGAGLLRFETFSARVLHDLVACVRRVPDATDLERVLARALADPSLQLAFPRGGSPGLWCDGHGSPMRLPDPGGDRWVVKISDPDGVIAAMICAGGLRLDRPLVEAAASLAAVALENQRLAADAAASLHALEASRARLVASAEHERRRIERDLHDGAQQRLVALRIELELVEDLIALDPGAGRERLRELGHDVDEALEELRALAHGVYPPLLADRGLAEAVAAVASRSPVRVDLVAHQVGRYPSELESAVYFCVLEALQNALKHAKGTHRIVVELDGGGEGSLRFVVRDDGAGTAPGSPLRPGAGITGMRDRLSAFGGELEVVSTAGVGTAVRGVVPTSTVFPGRPAS